MNTSFWQKKRVFLTGHTGFKGAWLSRMLIGAHAQLTGYSLDPPTQPNLFSLAGLEQNMNSLYGDTRDFNSLRRAFQNAAPEIVFHMAAQPIVRESYKIPMDTYDINVMGTVNLLECARLNGGVRSFLNVTTDKVYKNTEREEGYREDEPLDGFDPYSNSKSCSELVTHSYRSAFFSKSDCAVSTARAGNVIGGGDFASYRIIPDCVRSAAAEQPIRVRNLYSIRPYQHVLDSLVAYLLIAERQYNDKRIEGAYNVGPDSCDCISTGELVDLFCHHWGEGIRWINLSEPNAPHEAAALRLDCAKLKATFGWKPRWHVSEAVSRTCEWTKVWLNGKNIPEIMDEQIAAFYKEAPE
ncbi:MAG: CDP-glucose 4,6-dehydratase [Eubacteriales bacterium]|nr:CDP-glucose 4,6-dehydratase [Eubacteriales bacterium]